MPLHPKQQHIVDVYGKLPETFDEIGESTIAVLNETNKVVGFAFSIAFQKQVSNSHNAPVGRLTNWGGNKKDEPRNYPGMYGRVWYRYADRNTDAFGWNNFGRTLTYTGSGGGGAYDGLWTDICSAAYRTRKQVRDSSRAHGFRYDYEYPNPACFSLDYKIFLSDFPAVEELVLGAYNAHELAEDKAESWAKLNGKYYRRSQFNYKHRFKWEDPIVKAADDAFIEEYKATLAEGVEAFEKKKDMVYPAW